MIFPFTVLFVVVGGILAILAVPLMQRRIKPNALYGLRVPATFADEWVWYEANAQSGRDLFRLAVVFILFAVLLSVVPRISFVTYAIANGVFMLVGVIWFSIVGWVRANRLLRERRQSQGK